MEYSQKFGKILAGMLLIPSLIFIGASLVKADQYEAQHNPQLKKNAQIDVWIGAFGSLAAAGILFTAAHLGDEKKKMGFEGNICMLNQ